MSNNGMDSTNANVNPQTNATPVTPQAATNPYEFADEEKKEYGTFNLNTAFARAWSRAYRYGFNMGAPIEEPQAYTNNRHRQKFQYAYALTEDNDNPNQNVQFYDGRGFIIQDSGL